MEVVQMKYYPKEVYYENRHGVNYIILDYGDSKVEHVIAAQQSMHWTAGIVRRFKHFSVVKFILSLWHSRASRQ